MIADELPQLGVSVQPVPCRRRQFLVWVESDLLDAEWLAELLEPLNGREAARDRDLGR